MTARGLRNNNPGNIRKGDKWQGLAKVQQDAEFCTFETPVWGIRAIARLLIRYQDKYDLTTPKDIVSRWAPPSENRTSDYVRDVCKRAGWTTMQQVDMQKYEDNRKMVLGIIWHENGIMPYSAAQIDEGLKLAGIVQDAPRGLVAEATNPKSVTSIVTAAAATVSATVAPIASVWDQLATVIDPRILMWGVSLALGLVAAYLIIDRLKERREGRA